MSGHKAMSVINERINMGKAQVMEKRIEQAQKAAQLAQPLGKDGKPVEVPAPSPQVIYLFLIFLWCCNIPIQFSFTPFYLFTLSVHFNCC